MKWLNRCHTKIQNKNQYTRWYKGWKATTQNARNVCLWIVLVSQTWLWILVLLLTGGVILDKCFTFWACFCLCEMRRQIIPGPQWIDVRIVWRDIYKLHVTICYGPFTTKSKDYSRHLSIESEALWCSPRLWVFLCSLELFLKGRPGEKSSWCQEI